VRRRHQLVAAALSRHSAKVRAYLRFKKIAYDEIAASNRIYRTLIPPHSPIPLFISDEGVVVEDATGIIEFVELRYPSAAIFPKGPVQRLIALLMNAYAEDCLVLAAMQQRFAIDENRAFVVAELGQLAFPHAPPAARQEVGEALARRLAEPLEALGVGPETAPAIEASYLAWLTELDLHLTFQPYLLGTRPSFGDFALFGPLYAHLYRDPASGRLMKSHAPRVAAFVERMETPPRPLSGNFLDDDMVAPGIDPLLARVFGELGPLIEQAAELLRRRARDAPSGPVPRRLGRARLTLGGAGLEREVEALTLLRFQRAHAHYQVLTGTAREQADELLARTGGRELLAQPMPRLRREGRRLFCTESS